MKNSQKGPVNPLQNIKGLLVIIAFMLYWTYSAVENRSQIYMIAVGVIFLLFSTVLLLKNIVSYVKIRRNPATDMYFEKENDKEWQTTYTSDFDKAQYTRGNEKVTVRGTPEADILSGLFMLVVITGRIYKTDIRSCSVTYIVAVIVRLGMCIFGIINGIVRMKDRKRYFENRFGLSDEQGDFLVEDILTDEDNRYNDSERQDNGMDFYCPYCDGRVEQGEEYCPHCGNRLYK